LARIDGKFEQQGPCACGRRKAEGICFTDCFGRGRCYPWRRGSVAGRTLNPLKLRLAQVPAHRLGRHRFRFSRHELLSLPPKGQAWKPPAKGRERRRLRQPEEPAQGGGGVEGPASHDLGRLRPDAIDDGARRCRGGARRTAPAGRAVRPPPGWRAPGFGDRWEAAPSAGAAPRDLKLIGGDPTGIRIRRLTVNQPTDGTRLSSGKHCGPTVSESPHRRRPTQESTRIDLCLGDRLEKGSEALAD